VLVRNTFGGAPLAVWLRSGNANELRDNDAVGAHLDTFDTAEASGFLIGAAAQRTLIVGNSASDFDVNGFSVYGAQSQVGSNDATDNGAWGIDAIAGTTDLGGNTASGNGRPEQCRNVACAPG
jgi:hypothetical protein